jgi:hypothetical protein
LWPDVPLLFLCRHPAAAAAAAAAALVLLLLLLLLLFLTAVGRGLLLLLLLVSSRRVTCPTPSLPASPVAAVAAVAEEAGTDTARLNDSDADLGRQHCVAAECGVTAVSDGARAELADKRAKATG